MLAAIGALQLKGGIVNRQRNRFSDGAGLQGPGKFLLIILFYYGPMNTISLECSLSWSSYCFRKFMQCHTLHVDCRQS